MSWINYTSRNKELILADVIANLQQTSPDISDVSLGNPLIRSALIYAAIAEAINYNIDVAAQEGIAALSRTYRSAIAHARLSNYRVKNSIAASMDVTFKISSIAIVDIVIPAQTKITASSIEFYTVASCTIPIGQTTISVSAVQALTSETITSTSTGVAWQPFLLSDLATDSTLSVLINLQYWTKVENFAFSLPTDKHFVQTVGVEGRPVCLFGNGFTGLVPSVGDSISLTYSRTNGVNGNVASNTVTTITGAITLPTGITITAFNIASASGGTGIENTASIRRNIPNALLTVDRAVTSQDFEILSEMVGGVSRAGVKTECGRSIEIYIVPNGGGLATTQLKTDVANYLETRKLVGRSIAVLTAGIISIKLELNVRLGATANPTTTIADIKTRLATKFSYLNQKINSTIYLSDITEIIENTRGVNSSDIVLMNATPYARPLNVNQNLDWTVQVLSGSTSVAKWQIVFLGSLNYQLFRNGNFIGQFLVGTTVQKFGVMLKINTDVAIGSKFEFVSYRLVGNLILNEMSVPTISELDIAINIL